MSARGAVLALFSAAAVASWCVAGVKGEAKAFLGERAAKTVVFSLASFDLIPLGAAAVTLFQIIAIAPFFSGLASAADVVFAEGGLVATLAASLFFELVARPGATEAALVGACLATVDIDDTCGAEGFALASAAGSSAGALAVFGA